VTEPQALWVDIFLNWQAALPDPLVVSFGCVNARLRKNLTINLDIEHD
jgi:hypothetical protein